MERITSYQLFSLTVLFQIGTTIIFGFSSAAGRDAWIAALISTMIGIAIIIVYLTLMHLNPGLTLVEWFPKQFGKWIGTPIAWMYPLLFIYDAGRAAGDVKDLMPTTILPWTPQIVIISTLIATLAYALYSGIECIGRLSGIWMPIIIFLYIVVIGLISATGIINFKNVQPVMCNGTRSVWNAVWPLGITQSFGETIGFAMIWPLVKEKNKIFKATLLATLSSGLIICTVDFLAIMVLGEKIFSNSIYPIYTLIQQIEVANFIENLDSIGVIFFLTTTWFKLSVHLFGAIYGMQKLLKTKGSRGFIVPSAVIVIYLSMTMADDVLQHLDTGLKILPYNLWVPLFYILPLLLLIVTLIRNKIAKQPLTQT